MATKQKNILNVIFGAFLQDERKKIVDTTIDELCQKGMLGMSVSLYKMTEAGHASFNLNRLPDLIRVFKDSGLIFDRLAKFIAGQNYVDFLISNQNESPKDAFAELADIDSEFKTLYEQIQKYFDYSDGSSEQKIFIQDVAIGELKSFLQNKKYPISLQELFDNSLIDKVKNLPSLSMGLLTNFLESFTHIIPLHFGKIASDWEKKNCKQIVSVIGYYKSPDLIIAKENFQEFTYEYLSQKNFSSLKFYFDTTKSQDELQNKFKQNINESRQGNLHPFSEEVFNKRIELRPIPESKKDDADKLLIDPYNSKNKLQAFWVFTTIDGNKIGFVGINENYVSIGYNLSYSETQIRNKAFDRLWEN